MIGVTGMSSAGITMGRLEEATETAGMIGAARRTIVLAAQSKFDVSALARIAPWSSVDHLVTDAPPPPELAEALERAEVDVLVCR